MKDMMRFKKFLLTAFMLFVSCLVVSKSFAAQDIVRQTIGDMAIVKKTFPVDHFNNLKGYIVARKEDQADSRIVFALDNKAVVLGKVLIKDSKGKVEDLNSVYEQKYLIAEKSKSVYARLLEKGTWIQEGSDHASHKLFIFFDPNCIFCNLMYKNLHASKLIEEGKLQVRWVPVAFLKEDSLQKGAMLILKRQEPDIMGKNEDNFDEKTETGAIKDLPYDQKKRDVKESYDRLNINNSIFHLLGADATPTLLFRGENNQYSYLLGSVPMNIFKKRMLDFSKTW